MSEQLIIPEAEVVTSEEERPDLVRRKLLFPLASTSVEPDATALEDDPLPLPAVLADYIRGRCRKGEVVAGQSFLAPPFSVPPEQLQEAFDQFTEDADYRDIAAVVGENDRYYYSTSIMATNYADTQVLLLEQDCCRVIAEAVRFDSDVYPRPYKKRMLSREPYYFDGEQIDAALALMEQREEYQDIQRVTASNDEIYLFSQRFMSYGRARGLCEWLEVGQYENP